MHAVEVSTILRLIDQHVTGHCDSRTLTSPMACAVNCLFCMSNERVASAERGEKMRPLIDAGVVVNLLKFA